MNFLQLKDEFESKLNENYDFEILELHYLPYSFGSGMIAYRIKGRIIKIIFDGRENEVQLIGSKPHDKYPNCSWTTVFTGLPSEFIEIAAAKLNSLYVQNA